MLCHEKVRERTEIVVVAGKGKPFVPLVKGSMRRRLIGCMLGREEGA